MKKFLFIPLVIVLVVGFALGSCGEPEETTTTPPTTAPASTTPAPTTTAPAPTITAPEPTPTASPTEISKYGGILIRPLSVDPVKIGFGPESAGLGSIAALPALETFARHRAGDILEPMLATAWDVAPDGKSITLTLRQGVKFHDGTNFDASAAKWNIDKYIEKGMAEGFVSVDVVGDYEIRINVQQYTNMILEHITTIQVISPTSFEKNGMDWALVNPIGTGPFIFESYVRDSKIVYKRNPDYWNTGRPYLDGYEWVVIPDETVRKIAFENGEIHTLRALGLTAQELEQKGYYYDALPGGTFILMPDSANPDSPLANKDVRLAISYAIDREALANALGYGFIKTAYQIYPSFSAAIPNLQKHQYDQDKARTLLAEAGYPEGFEVSIHDFLQVVPKEYISSIAGMLNEVGIKTTA